MCNRYRQWKTKEVLGSLFSARPLGSEPLPFEEIFPKRKAALIRKDGGERVIDEMIWGIPLAQKSKRTGLPIAPKPVTNVRNLASGFWKSTIGRTEWRCLVPFTSFAEPKIGQGQECWWFDLPSNEVAVFAGIWRPSEWGNAFAFLTCEPNPLVAPLHPKAMPVILQPDDYDRWLDGDTDEVCSLASPFPSQLMRVA
jgi:putative SOS response-associated peptidase YedK